jgi:acyl-homoserine-lactone acylase
MRNIRNGLALLAGLLVASSAAADDLARWKAEAAKVTITRDDWGIAHVVAPTDALAVFGGIYAQAEDDFNRVEANYVHNLGREAEVEGEGALWSDLRQRLFLDPEDLKAQYAAAPDWLKRLMDAWADGLNYYLATHPATKPRLITHFEPWMTLAFSEGSIGGDIEDVDLDGLADFYGATKLAARTEPRPPGGSNGIALAPRLTASGHAMLLINPHTSFYFRSELQMTSGEGLNAYGASTWGQFFLYQGFNAHAGWMHPTSTVNNIDYFAETVSGAGADPVYRYGSKERRVGRKAVTLSYRGADGAQHSRTYSTYFTHHGPVVRREGGKWIAVAMLNNPVAALEQSFLRTKATDLAGFIKVGELKANSSNNTIFADDKGEIAFLTPQFIPRRDNRFDYTEVVDGADPATDWKGLHDFSERPNILNPASGFVYNTNNWPYGASGRGALDPAKFPRYMDMVGETPRGLHGLRVLEGHSGFSLDGLIGAAFDPYLPEFAKLIPTLTRAYDQLGANDPRRARLAEPVALLRGWDCRWAADSQATSLAVAWGEALEANSPRYDERHDAKLRRMIEEDLTADQRLAALETAMKTLTADFGDWRIAWGQINRAQRLTDAITAKFDDAAPSTPVPFVSGDWGSLAAFEIERHRKTHKRYGISGNSFLAAIEFGPKVKARAVSIGGESGDPSSPHFRDQVERYARGDFRSVYFYPEDLKGHTERVYHPGE